MIHNEREFKITKSVLVKLEDELVGERNDGIPEWVAEAHANALLSQVEELRGNIEEYEHLKSEKQFIWECSDLRDLPEYLIKARISSGLSQKQLAEILKLKPQQIQRYESEYYKGANLNRLIDVASAVGVSVSGFIERPDKAEYQDISNIGNSDIDWKKFPIKEMIRRGWVSSQEEIQGYVERYAGIHYATTFHRKKMFGQNKPNIYSLLAWQARVLEKASKETQALHIKEFQLDDSWVREFVQLSNYENSPIAAKHYLAERGILLIVERHLDRTYLDGAAMVSPMGTPIIALTLRHDRLDNFWFVLMHELGHIFRHIYQSFNLDFFDEEGGVDGDAIEREADEFALESLIPNELWELCVSRFSMTKDAVISDSERLNINPAVIAGRLRKEKANFYLLNELVGNGTVRESLKEFY